MVFLETKIDLIQRSIFVIFFLVLMPIVAYYKRVILNIRMGGINDKE